jgi:hypothetical protein
MDSAMSGDGISLDPEAQKLFEQFGGTESWKAAPGAGKNRDNLARSLLEEQRRLDRVRILLIQMAHLISRYLVDDAFAGLSPSEPGEFKALVRRIAELARISGHLGCAFIRFRGAPKDPELPDKYDYELMVGNTLVDSSMAPRVALRCGKKMAALPDQLLSAFTTFADYGVNNIYIQIPDDLDAQLDSLRMCLKILSGFRTARKTGTAIRISSGSRTRTVPLVNDENMFPDPNLTLLAGINGLGPGSMAGLVDKVDQWLRRQENTSALKKYAGVYNAALDLPKRKAGFKAPPIEMNNVKWLLQETEDESVSLEKVFVARLAMDQAASTPQKVVKMIKSVYGDDYNTINPVMLGERLNLSSDLLSAAEKHASREKGLKQEVLGNLNRRLDQVEDHVIDDIQVTEDTGREGTAGDGSESGKVHSQVYRLVNFYKGRASTRKKMVGMVHRSIAFQERDFTILAKDFRISVDDARALVAKLKGCFSDDGRFKKNGFLSAIGHFQQYEQKIFGFLWHHMKDAILPDDRVAFLNALQALTAQMNQPKRAFKILLEDICRDPEKVQFSDNKAIMLTNLIVHRPDKALADYEITPEDIVLNQHNIDKMVAQYASWRIDRDRENFFTKAQTVHSKLAEALQLGKTSDRKIPAAVLLNLERELYIFLSLVACDTGKAILRSAVHEYGDPQSDIYHKQFSAELMGGLLQNLRVALRGVGTIGNWTDIALLEAVQQHNEDFQRLKNDRQFRSQAKMVTEWADEAIKLIKFRSP